uniref:Chordin like 2 n=1 Tax=Salvator merianae TaxID=96440 RepID=A0A8D0BHJ5_SALMN
TYQHGDIFTHNEPLPSRQSNQCTQCSCSEGHIYCHLVTCPELLCASPQTTPDSCCQVCRESVWMLTCTTTHSLTFLPCRRVLQTQSQYPCRGVLRSKGSQGAADSPTGASLEFIPKSVKPRGASSGTTVKIILKEKHKKACVYRGKTYSHGEVWHPTIPRLEVVSCILCTCRDGNQDCRKITCPKQYPCEEPEHVEGKCCKVCPEDKVIPADEIDVTKCRVSVYMFVPSSTPENPRENLRKIAIERESSEDVEIYIWKPLSIAISPDGTRR